MPVLRRATTGDAEALSILARRTWREMSLEDFAIPYPPSDVAAFEESRSSVNVVWKRIVDPRQATWILEDEGAPIGFADAGPCALPHPEAKTSHLELNRLYLLRPNHGRGHGGQLLDVALDWMTRRSSGPQWVGVWSGNERAQRIYARRGFTVVGECDFSVGNWIDRDFMMRRRR